MGQSISRPPQAELLKAVCGLTVLAGVGLALRADCDFWTGMARMPRNFYRGKVVWVTGASSGIGRALCEDLARLGADLILTSRRKEVLDSLAVELLGLGAKSASVVVADLCDGDDACEDAARRALEIHGGRLDVLVNNAGVSMRATAAGLEMEGVRRMLQLNFFAPVALTRACLPALSGALGNGMIMNISSISSVLNTAMRSSYCASKSALDAYFTSLRNEESGIRIISVRPGSTATDVSVNAMIPGGRKHDKRDESISNGLPAARVSERALAAAASGLTMACIAAPHELWRGRKAQYFPE